MKSILMAYPHNQWIFDLNFGSYFELFVHLRPLEIY